MRARSLLPLITLAGLALRGWCFVGWGLGDDPYYARTAVWLTRGRFDLSFASNYRLGLHLPNALALGVFGVSDLAFVLFPLACSLLTIPVTYLLGRGLGGERAGLLAAVLVAVSPFDVVHSTTMTIDLATSFLCATAALLLLRGEAAAVQEARCLQLLAALLLFWAYLVKIPALLFVGVLGVYTASARSLWRKHATLYAALFALLATSLLADWLVTGNALGYWSSERWLAPRLQPELGTGWYLAFYPQQMFGPLTRAPFGLTFPAALLALGYAAVRRLPGRRLLVPWLLGLFLVLQFLPNRLALPYEPLPRFPRYLAALVVPALLLVAIALDDLMRRHASLAALACGALVVGSLWAAHAGASRLQEGLADTRAASRFVLAQLPAPVYSDNHMLNRIDFDRGYTGGFALMRIQAAIERARNATLLEGLGPGYVITGGSRGPDVWERAVFDLGPLRPPPLWRLLHTIEGAPSPWRREPLRIFGIGHPARFTRAAPAPRRRPSRAASARRRSTAAPSRCRAARSPAVAGGAEGRSRRRRARAAAAPA